MPLKFIHNKYIQGGEGDQSVTTLHDQYFSLISTSYERCSICANKSHFPWQIENVKDVATRWLGKTAGNFPCELIVIQSEDGFP